MAGVIHDVNQMLAVVIGRAGLLLSRGPDLELEANLQAMELAARDATSMLLRVNSSAEDPPTGEVPWVSLRQTVAEAGMLIAPPGGASWSKDTDSAWSLEIGIPADLAAGIPAQIVREVLNNLLLNSLEASPDGVGIQVAGTARQSRVLLTFADDGPGLSETVRATLFQPGHSTSELPGRGIGLAGCRNLLRKWGGELRLGGQKGPGAVFELDLPEAGTAVTTAGAAAGQVQPGRSVLIVDDELAVREMLGDVMAELGCTVALARDSVQALEIFVPGGFDVVILDQSLPGMQGEELAGFLRRKDPAVAIILASGWGKEKILAGVDPDHVDLTTVKPLEMSKMVALLSEGATLVDRRRGTDIKDGTLDSKSGREKER
ncbi:MAG: response regulator [Gemmatimonadales bacterium]|nr:response regulator [Gemmatimonadales bacterium]